MRLLTKTKMTLGSFLVKERTMLKNQRSGDVRWLCSCAVQKAIVEECPLCKQKRPLNLETNPVLDFPLGPGYHWYKHPDQPSPEDPGKLETVDPTVIEVGIQGTEFVAMVNGGLMSLKTLPGKWQRVVKSSFHDNE